MPSAKEFLRPETVLPVLALIYFYFRHHSTGYLLGGTAVVAAFLFLYAGWDRAGRRPIGTAVLVLLGLALPSLGTWQYLQMQDIGDMDQSAYVNALWNVRHGSLDYSLDGYNMFGIHSQYTAVLWAPLLWLGGPLGLKLGQGLALLAACLLSVRRLQGNREAATWGAVALLLSPAIASQFLFGFHPEMLGAPALVLALQAYRQEQLGRFLALTAFLAYTKESFTLAIGGILLLALLERRSWKWILLPGLLCCLLMSIYWYGVLPIFAPKGNHLSYFMPSTPSEILSMWSRSQNIFYAVHIYLPFLPLLLAFPKRYMVLPLPLMAFYAAFPDPLFVVMWPNYAFPLAILCSAPLVLSPALLPAPGSDPMPRSGPIQAERLFRVLDGRIPMACAVISLLSYPLWREIITLPAGNLARSHAVDALQDRLPPDASVVVNGPFITRLAERRTVSMWGNRKDSLETYDYVVIDDVLPFWQVTREERSRSADSLARHPGWIREYSEDGLHLFRPDRTRP